MLDGLLGRGFSVKCKSLAKATRARIEVVRRRVEAKQRCLKEHLAKLLSNGLDINAYGRTEEFLAGMDLLSCYDFIEQSCEYIVKQLSRMQKQGECPEECREAVASLMFAAARFSDLPELRDLRDIFQQRYGNSLEVYANQKFVEKLSSRPAAAEKRLQVLQVVASEFSIKWDSRGFERRKATPSVVAQVPVQKADIFKQRPGLLDESNRIQNRNEDYFLKSDESDNHVNRKKEEFEYKEMSLLKRGESSSRGDNEISYGRDTSIENKNLYYNEKGDTKLKVERSSCSSHAKELDNVYAGKPRPNDCFVDPRKGEMKEALFREKSEFAPSCVEHLGKIVNVVSSHNDFNRHALNSIRKGPEEESDRLKPCSIYSLPPPYVKLKDRIARPPYINPKEDKYRDISDGSSMVKGSDTPHNERDNHNHEEQIAATAKVKKHGHEKEVDFPNGKIPLPKPRSIRRKHHKSSSSSNTAGTGACEDINRSSSRSRRKEHVRNGLQILFDEEHQRKDDEERTIDKLLIHYSKKPSSYDDAGKLRKKLPPGQQPLQHQIISDDVVGSSLHRSRDAKVDVFPPPSRSVSLPHEQTASQELKKVMTCANTFQADNQARHVHPKLPDYDDLAARFIALKGR